MIEVDPVLLYCSSMYTSTSGRCHNTNGHRVYAMWRHNDGHRCDVASRIIWCKMPPGGGEVSYIPPPGLVKADARPGGRGAGVGNSPPSHVAILTPDHTGCVPGEGRSMTRRGGGAMCFCLEDCG